MGAPQIMFSIHSLILNAKPGRHMMPPIGRKQHQFLQTLRLPAGTQSKLFSTTKYLINSKQLSTPNGIKISQPTPTDPRTKSPMLIPSFPNFLTRPIWAPTPKMPVTFTPRSKRHSTEVMMPNGKRPTKPTTISTRI
eukprot:UN04411